MKKIVFTTARCYHHHKKYSFHYIDGGFFLLGLRKTQDD